MTTAELLEKAKTLPTTPGVYVMKDATGKEIYVGKAKSLRDRVSSYFRPTPHDSKTTALVENVVDFEIAPVPSELEAFLLENCLIKDLQPKYNLMLKSNELYPYIEVTWGEEFPRAFINRRQDNPHSRYFGPFVGATDLRACLHQLQRLFQFRPCQKNFTTAEIRRRPARPCLNYHLGRCAGICAGRIDKETYRRRLTDLCRFLSGQKIALLTSLRTEMQEAAAKLQFEEAAALRDLIRGLENLNQYPLVDENLAPTAPILELGKGNEKLAEIFHLSPPPKIIEGFDIANLQGQETVGALVNFIDGQPNKNHYRRFRIKTVAGQDDFACLAEIMRRRYSNSPTSLAQSLPLPDIILIDGGKGQLHAVAAALDEIHVTPRLLLSLAKKEELIFQRDHAEPIRLARRNPALRLLMRVRDEAHRFAQHYHHILRGKAMFGEAR
jgi:excinuclease ABC subunit C